MTTPTCTSDFNFSRAVDLWSGLRKKKLYLGIIKLDSTDRKIYHCLIQPYHTFFSNLFSKWKDTHLYENLSNQRVSHVFILIPGVLHGWKFYGTIIADADAFKIKQFSILLFLNFVRIWYLFHKWILFSSHCNFQFSALKNIMYINNSG